MASNPGYGKYSGLGYYVREVLFDEFKRNRQDVELKWEKNLNAFRAISEKKWKKGEGKDWRSDTYIQLPKQKIMAAYAMVMDMLLQGGKIPFALIPSPLDNIVLEDLPDDQRAFIEDSIDDMTAVINQQFQDCYADRQLMKNVMCGAIYGETYGKRYVHEVVRKGYRMVSMGPGEKFNRYEKYEVAHNSPGYKYVSNWNMFRDIESDDTQTGAAIIEREMICSYDLRQLKGDLFYIDEAIERAIKEAEKPGGSEHGGDKDSSLPPVLRDVPSRKKTIEHLIVWGRVPVMVARDFENEVLKKSKMDSFDSLSEFEHDGNEVEVMVEMADQEVIRYAINDSGDRPYYRIVWEDKLDHAEATGVADNVQDVAQVVNGMVRAFEDNLKLVANVILAIKKRYLAPGALKDGIKPGMELEIAEEVDDARKALQQITITDVTGSLINGIPLFERYADEGSQIPKILQGVVAEKHKPDTLGELNMLQQNSGKYLGSVIKNFDESLIEPVVQDFYEYNMEDPELDKGKGNFIAQALGFSSFQDRAIKMQKLMQGLNLIMSHETLMAETKAKEVLFELWKALDLDPTTVFKTKEEKEAEMQQSMEMRAQEEARVRQIQSQMMRDELDAKIAEYAAKHEMDIDKEEVKHENDMEMSEMEFGQDLVLKSIDGGREQRLQ